MENLAAGPAPAPHATILARYARPPAALAPHRLRSVLSCIDARFSENVCVRELPRRRTRAVDRIAVPLRGNAGYRRAAALDFTGP